MVYGLFWSLKSMKNGTFRIDFCLLNAIRAYLDARGSEGGYPQEPWKFNPPPPDRKKAKKYPPPHLRLQQLAY